jgi:hypothetical protein
MHKNATKCNETLSKWCKSKHGASKIIDTFETYHSPPPTAPLFIPADRREAGSSAGNSGGKGNSGKQRRKVFGRINRQESGGVAAKGAPSVGLALP